MSITYERIKIGVEENGETKLIEDLDLDNLSYNLVSEGGEIFAAERGTESVVALRRGEPDKNFLVLPA